ncbi:MAG TPA: serine protease [Verrucomicrobiae bacterium]|nr:serine protease [Verrucomicrobiae bacterium]
MQTFLLNLGVALVLILPAGAAPAHKAARPKRPAAPAALPLNLVGEVNDFRIEDQLDLAAEQLMAAGKTAKMSELIRQLSRRTCSVELPRFTPKNSSGAEIAETCRPGVVVIGDLSKCKKCPKWHVGASSGFLLTDSGVCVTCYHVVHVPESPTLIAMTGDGRIVAVKEVLAANPHTDLALLQLDGSGFRPLPLDTNAPAGSTVRVLSHPDDHFFTLSEGIVSRYVALPLEKAAGEVTFMAVTADFGAGSSGAPVFNEQGGVVGLVNNTQSLYYDPKKGRDLQMVFKHCLPSQYILQLIEKK